MYTPGVCSQDRVSNCVDCTTSVEMNTNLSEKMRFKESLAMLGNTIIHDTIQRHISAAEFPVELHDRQSSQGTVPV